MRFPTTPPANIPSASCPHFESKPSCFLKIQTAASAMRAIDVSRYVCPDSMPQAAPSFVIWTIYRKLSISAMGELSAPKWYVGFPLSHGILATIASFVSWSRIITNATAAKNTAEDLFFDDFSNCGKIFLCFAGVYFFLLPLVSFAVQPCYEDMSSSSSVVPDWPSDISYIDLCTDFILRVSASLISCPRFVQRVNGMASSLDSGIGSPVTSHIP